jgi:hypothetical protein
LKAVNVVILSGSCCSPNLASVDEKIQVRIKELAEKSELKANIAVVTISAAAVGGVVGVSKEVDQSIRHLIADKGMSVLPVVLFNGNIAFYGGLASATLIDEKLKEYANDSFYRQGILGKPSQNEPFTLFRHVCFKSKAHARI